MTYIHLWELIFASFLLGIFSHGFNFVIDRFWFVSEFLFLRRNTDFAKFFGVAHMWYVNGINGIGYKNHPKNNLLLTLAKN